MLKKILLFCSMQLISCSLLFSQNNQNNPNSNHGNKFEQLGTIMPTPNEYRTASGAPGPKYWQQRVDYDIKCELDENNQKLTGWETITYHNNSPDILSYLWLQLDENQHSSVNNANYQNSSQMPRQGTDKMIDAAIEKRTDNGYGFKITKLVDANGKALKSVTNKTMMRVELPMALKPGQKFVFKVDWNYKLADRRDFLRFSGARGGYEFFQEDGNHIFTIAQWYPRLCMYSDEQGWQNHQFTGRGEFTLCFGNFKVQMTVPADHVVGSTGECQNYQQNLPANQKARWQKAQTAKEPIEIVTLEEAKAAEKKKSTAKKTWIFKADNVRDFAWTSSRKFVWDAMPANVEGKKVMCMSFYAKEAYPIYNLVSTKAVAHTIKTYSKFSIPYPYPVAQSVEASNGMEYPMICFNYGRTEKDRTYSEATKYGMLGVIIHEVGHNFFPMIINSDERQWTWMDEGLNTFVEYLTEELFDSKFPSRRGPAFKIVDYMKGDQSMLEPIMSNSENILSLGSNAYAKPATALNILRETILGRELFDKAFKEYAMRWKFKHPSPADFFRTMEDASAVDLDWFWRGWFFTSEPVDIELADVKWNRADQPDALKTHEEDFISENPHGITSQRNREVIAQTQDEIDRSLRDQYTEINDQEKSKQSYLTYVDKLSPEEKALIEEGKNYYTITFKNKGGL